MLRNCRRIFGQNIESTVADARPNHRLRMPDQVEMVGAEQIADLLAMTPHLYRASAEGRAKAAALTRLVVTVAVCLTRFGVDPLR